MNERIKERPKPIDPELFQLKLKMSAPLFWGEPYEYATQFKGRIFAIEYGGFAVTAGRMTLTRYDLNRAELDGQNPLEVFDCLSEEALDLYQALYDGFDFKDQVRAAVDDVLNPSLLVLETLEVLPKYRGGGLGLMAALKAIHLLGPAGGMVALLAAPINEPFWHPRMKMEAFPPDSPEVREKLGKYWEQLGFKPLGTNGRYLRNLENLPRISELLSMQR